MEPKEIIQKLRAPFDVADHELRVLRETRTGKAQWSVYIRREAITDRLDELFGLDWEFHIDRIHDRLPECITVTGAIIINGKRRTNNGGASPNGNNIDENVEKAAVTDCFKRCASSWGIGLYLQNTPDIYTDGTKDKDWNAKSELETEATQRFANWLRTLTPGNIVPIEQGKQALAPAGKVISTPLGSGNNRRLPPKNTPVGGETAPLDVMVNLKNNKAVQAAWNAPQHGENTINKMWKEGTIHADMSDAEMVRAVVARLKRKSNDEAEGAAS